jgi:uncharacterized membrane protein
MTRTNITLEKTLPYILLIGSIVGLIAAFALTYDKIHVLQNPDYEPACNVSPIISCGSVMEKPQASLLGVPNTIFGLMGFSALMTIATLAIMGVRMPKKVWLGIGAGLIGGLIFAGYLFFQGVFRINAICPFCFMVWVVMPTMFWYTTLYILRQGYVRVNAQLNSFLQRHHGDILMTWYVFFLGILFVKFWYYWSTLL